MYIEQGDAVKLRRDVVTQTNWSFKRRFMLFFILDLIMLTLCVALCFFSLVLGLILVLSLFPRICLAIPVMSWRGSAIKMYTSINFHRTDTLRRFATSSQHPMFSAWIAASYFSAIAVLFFAILAGIVVVVLSFGTGILEGVGSLLSELFMLSIALYLVMTERLAYDYAVTRMVDGVLDSQQELRRLYVVSSARIHNQKINSLLQEKSGGLLIHDSSSVGLGFDTKITTRNKTPNRKHN